MDPIEDLLDEIAAQGDDAWLAIAQCTARLPESGPALRSALARAADHGCRTAAEGNLVFAALHVLGGRRDPQACPSFLKLLRRPAEELDSVLGDAAAITLPLIAAGVFDGDADAFFSAIMDRDIDDVIRFGLFGAAAFLTWDHRISRENTVGFLKRFDAERGAEPSRFTWSGWELAISLLGLHDLAPQVEAAFRDGRIDPGWGTHADFMKRLARAEAAPNDISRFHDEHLGYIVDVLEAIEQVTRGEPFYGDDSSADERYDEIIHSFTPVSNPLRHVGRNDPCPCGSGKKYKKCCLGKEAS